MSVLLVGHLRHDFEAPWDPNNDHLIFSKGHAAPLLYALYKAAGVLVDEELLTLRRLGSRLEGHPTPALPWVDVATGSLGQGLPVGVGLALAAKRLDRLPSRVWVLCGDGEMAEGSIWEAAQYAGFIGAGQPDRDHRREPAWAVRPDDARLGPWRVCPPPGGVRLADDAGRRARRRRD
jgi:transketolase